MKHEPLADVQSASSDREALDALDRVLNSQTFAGSDRLKELLSYVVNHQVSKPDSPVPGKQIAADVYGRQVDGSDATVGVVRVDASRLRRRLDAYYLDEGAKDPVRIHIDNGGYAPRFERLSKTDAASEPLSAPTTPPKTKPIQLSIGTFALILTATGFLGAFVWSQFKSPGTLPSSSLIAPHSQVARQVLFETSPKSLQAVNLAEQGRRMLFPATDPDRLRATLVLFERAIQLDPTYFGGYAGAAQATAMFGGMAPEGKQRDEMLTVSRKHAKTALEMAPTQAWSQSSMALLRMFERDFDEANKLSIRATKLDPDDLIALELDGIIAFFSGDFERALSSSSPDIHSNRADFGLAWRNVYGNASFYTGDYERAIATLYDSAASGGSVSEINTAHLIASLQASGRTDEAAKLMVDYEAAWPNSRIEEFMHRLFRDRENAENLIEQLRAAGWREK